MTMKLNPRHKLLVESFERRNEDGRTFAIMPVEVNGQPTTALMHMVHLGDRILMEPWFIVPTDSMRITDNSGSTSIGIAGYTEPVIRKED